MNPLVCLLADETAEVAASGVAERIARLVEEKRATEIASASTPRGQKTSAVSAAFADVNVIFGISYRW